VAGKRLTWIFQLLDRMAGPSKRIAAHLDDIDRKARRARGESTRLDRGLRQLGQGSKRGGDGVGWLGLKLTGWIYTARTALGLVTGLARGVGGLAFGFLSAGVKAAAFKESTMLGLNMMLRDKGTASALYREAVSFADVSPFETQETLQWYRQLVPGIGTGGIGTPGGSNIMKVLAGLGDIAASTAAPSETMGHMILQITQMLSKGRALGNDLRPLSEAGVNLGKVYAILGKKKGLSAAALQSPAWEGKIGAGEMLNAILQFSAETYGGGQLGGGMGPASRTFTGLMSTLASRPYRMFEDLGETGGFKSMKKALENLVSVLDPATPAGQRIKKNIEEVFGRMLGGVFKRFEDPKAVENWINTLLRGLERLAPKIGELADALGRMAARADLVGRVLAVTTSPIETAKESMHAFERSGAVQLGERGDVIAHLRRLYGKGKLGPLERDELKMYEGWARRIGVPLEPFQRPSAPEKGPSSFNFAPGTIQIQINGAQDPKAVGDEVEERLASMFERLALSAGAISAGA
jgi:tape measure domain-containing protein